jgi:hypothetical protein
MAREHPRILHIPVVMTNLPFSRGNVNPAPLMSHFRMGKHFYQEIVFGIAKNILARQRLGWCVIQSKRVPLKQTSFDMA